MKKIIALLLAVIVLITFAPIESVRMTAQAATSKATVVPYSSVSTHYSDCNITITVYGRPTCFNTLYVLDCIVDLGIDQKKGVKVQFADIDQNPKADVTAMMNDYKNTNITFCYDTSTGVSRDSWIFAEKAGFGNSYTLPLVVFKKSDGTILKITQSILDKAYLEDLANGDLSSETIVGLSVTGEENYTYAYKVLSELNDLREKLNLPTLVMDETLLEAAMQRAAELSVYYSHTRPNGKKPFTLTPRAVAENIAMGQTTPANVMDSWTNSSGHYANMTDSYFHSVGIGCFKTSDGELCWVQLFSVQKTDGIKKSGTAKKTHTIEAQRRLLSLSMETEKDIHTLGKGKTVKINIQNRNKDGLLSYQKVNPSDFTFKSSNTKIATVSSNGTVTRKGTGTVTITVTNKTDPKTKLTAKYNIGHVYTNDCDASCNICKANRSITHPYKTTVTKATLSKNGSSVKKCTACGKVASKGTIKYVKTIKLSTTSYTYNAYVKTPSVTVKDSAGKTLKKGIDYTVTYASGRKNVGTYKVTVKMKGKYSGTKTLTFKIVPPKTTVTKLTAATKSFTVSFKKQTKQVSGYEIQYGTTKSVNAKIKTVTSYKTAKVTLKNLKAKRTYYVRVRTYKTVNGKKLYSAWSAYKSVKTKA